MAAASVQAARGALHGHLLLAASASGRDPLARVALEDQQHGQRHGGLVGAVGDARDLIGHRVGRRGLGGAASRQPVGERVKGGLGDGQVLGGAQPAVGLQHEGEEEEEGEEKEEEEHTGTA